MGFLQSWSWWVLLIVAFIGHIASALGVFGRGSARETVNLVGMGLVLIPSAFQWLFSGWVGFMASALATYLVSRPLSNRLILGYLGKQGIVHYDPEVAMDIARAETIRERRQSDVLKRLRTRPWDAFQEFDKGDRQEAEYRSLALAMLTRQPPGPVIGLDSIQIENLITRIQHYLGPVQPRSIVKIVQNPAVVKAFKHCEESDHTSDTELFVAIQLGRLT